MKMMRLLGVLLALAVLAGCSAPSLLITPVTNKNDLEEKTVLEGEGRGKILIIPVEGLIYNGRGPSFFGEAENPISVITQQLQKAQDDSSVSAVVLRISSPGGTVTASDTLYDLITQFKKKTGRPVVASIQEVGASGAYYTALAGDQIVAMPTSVVGSIGVVFTSFDVEGILGKIGARTYTIKSGTMKDMGSPFKALTPQEREILQAMIDQYFKRFEGIVQERRNLTAEQVKQVNDGRVFTGEQAEAMHLVDRLGSLEDAIDLARVKGNTPKAKAILYIRPYGYGGSIYAGNQAPSPQASSPLIKMPLADETLPTGFYFLWRPGLF